MMSVSRSDAMTMPLEEYEARLWHWNKAHSTGDDIKAPDAERTAALLERINSDPRLTN